MNNIFVLCDIVLMIIKLILLPHSCVQRCSTFAFVYYFSMEILIIVKNDL